MVRGHIYILQVLFAVGVTLGSRNLDYENRHTWVSRIARYVIYILTVQGSRATSVLMYEILRRKRDLDAQLFSKVNRNRFIIYLGAVAIVYLNNQAVFADDLPLMLIAYLIVKYPEMDTDQKWLLMSVQKEPKAYDHESSSSVPRADKSEFVPAADMFNNSTVFTELEHCPKMLASSLDSPQLDEHVEACSQAERSPHSQGSKPACQADEELARDQKHKGSAAVSLGAGLACSYIEGYLVYIIPPDGSEKIGLQDNIRIFESKHNVVFPVKRMFIIVTKSMHCPPDLKEFNDKSDREDVNRLEACPNFGEVVIDVAGVKNRNYKNSAYKIIRPNKRPVYIAAECVSSLYSMYKVMKNTHYCKEVAGVNVNEIVSDFLCTLRSALDRSPDYKNKCEVIFFDDTDKSLNLPDVLLERIRILEPHFEEYIRRRR